MRDGPSWQHLRYTGEIPAENIRLPIRAHPWHAFNVPKTLSRDQLQARKDKAVRFVRDVLNDPDRADEIDEESLEDYAERRKIRLTNPSGRVTVIMMKQELLDRVQDL